MGIFSRRFFLKSLLPSSIATLVGVAHASEEKDGNAKKISGINDGKVYVDDFGADPTGRTDSTGAVMRAIQSIAGISNSRFHPDASRYARVIFGAGVYVVADIPFLSGIVYSGMGRWATRIVPRTGSSFAFNTSGTLNYAESKANAKMRLISAGLKDMSIGCELQDFTLNKIPQGSGAVRIANASYFILENVVIRSLNGCGLQLEEVWDSDFTNLRIMGVGNASNINKPVPGLYIGPGDNKFDGSNALRFRGLHIEDCAQLMQLDVRTRHVFFTSPKLEGTNTIASNTITGGIGITFDCPELTWQFPDKPMFTIDYKNQNEGVGIVFESPSMISSDRDGRHGWYFLHKENPFGLLVINNPFMRSVSKLFEGGNAVISGGTAHACGPSIIRAFGQVFINNLHLKFIRPQNSNKEDYTLHLSGEANVIKNCSFESFNSRNAASSIIYMDETCINNIVADNFFFGSRDHAIECHHENKNTINGNIISQNSKYSSLINKKTGG
ncbi:MULTISPECIES: hypothetical protein [Klebsiella pneumoniae complex]|uniref:hypothetical protein n=1 Tax=Klebsiella pneumoniae complex TaxID=3390273 RepID=UPI0021A303F8|nr:hypothetical protein [Klebsiella variicola]UWS42636.1 hypothetical protein N1F85_17090 [Klebsiella variicola]